MSLSLDLLIDWYWVMMGKMSKDWSLAFLSKNEKQLSIYEKLSLECVSMQQIDEIS